MKETIENSQEGTDVFLISFLKTFAAVREVLKIDFEDEKQKMENVYNSLAQMLSAISGLFPSERRDFLDLVAGLVSDEFNEYQFVSPEQTLQIDPDIHDAHGVGSGTVKEGKTFAVIRKSTRKAVKYAEIKVN